MKPKINILIRTHRPSLANLLASIDYPAQTHIYEGGKTKGFDYNLFCNDLKSRVVDGWFMIADDDDTFIPGALERISHCLSNPDVMIICQMKRGAIIKPNSHVIAKGCIGMPCFFLHAKHKNIADFDNTEAADFHFIRDVAAKLHTVFVPIPVINSPRRNYGA